MPFISEIVNFRSLSIVGLEKNTGKTECLNYILGRLKDSQLKLALTSIGVDGENRDIVTNTAKPEIKINQGTIFISAEKHYLQRRITSEIIDVSNIHTSLGRLITARALSNDKVLLSGPPDTHSLKEIIKQMRNHEVDLTIVDGALSRLSLASPTVTEGLILATGAALSANIPELTRKTKYVVDLINLPQIESVLATKLETINEGIYTIDTNNNIYNPEIKSVFMLEQNKDKIFKHGNRIFVAGAVSNNLLAFLRIQKNIANIELIIKDFTRVFATPEIYYSYIKKGGTMKVLLKNKLVAVCINPTSPKGYRLDSNTLKTAMQESLQLPVYDIKNLN